VNSKRFDLDWDQKDLKRVISGETQAKCDFTTFLKGKKSRKSRTGGEMMKGRGRGAGWLLEEQTEYCFRQCRLSHLGEEVKRQAGFDMEQNGKTKKEMARVESAGAAMASVGPEWKVG